MREHALKTWPSYFTDILEGRKTFELRSNDRDFAVGDILVLEEWNPEPLLYNAKGYTGRKVRVEVTSLLQGGRFGLPPGLCVMSIRKVE